MKKLLPSCLFVFCLLVLPSTVQAQLIINEFMANNVSSADVDEDGKHSDWMEIQNNGSTAVSLNGWYLTDDATALRKWQFPVTTPVVSLAPAARLVVWASSKNRKAVITKLHTNFKLSASAGFLALVRPDGVTMEHSYNLYPAQFPNVTYGIASTVSTQILLADTPSAASGKAKVATDATDFSANFPGWNSSLSYNDASWQSGVAFGYGSPFTSLVVTSLSSVMLNLNASAFVRYKFNVATGAINAVRLKVKYDDGYIAYLNGTQIAQDRNPPTPTWNSNATSDRADGLASTAAVTTPANGPSLLLAGQNLLAIQILNSTSTNANVLLRPQLEVDTLTSTTPGYLATATRGVANGGLRTNVGPTISSTTDKPAQPAGGASSLPLLITTKVGATLNPLAAVDPVTLKWRVQFGTETAVVMVDNGTNGDVKAGDGIYTCSVPTTSLTAGQIIRWRIEAKDNTSQYSYDPAYPGFSPMTLPTNPPVVDQAIEFEQYFGTMSVPTLVGNTSLPTLYWFFTGTDNSGSSTLPNTTYPGTRGSFFWQPLSKDNPGIAYTPPKPRFYDNVLVNLHGQSSAGFPKKSHDMSFSKDNKFLWKDDTPETAGVNLLTNYADKTKVRNPVAWWTWEKTQHLASHYDSLVRVQQNGVFKGLYDLVENANASWLSRQNLDIAGALYKVYNQLELATITTNNTTVEKKNPNDNDSSDLAIFVTGIATANTMTNRLKFAYDNADIPSLVNLLATHSILLSRDFGHKNYYIYRDTHGTGEWSMLPWDQDLCMGHTWNATPGYWDDDIHSQAPMQIGVSTNRLMEIVYNTPELNYMFVRRLRTLVDQFYISATAMDGPWQQRITSILNQIDPDPNNPATGTDDADLDMRSWGYWTDGAGGSQIAYTAAAVLDHTVRTQAGRLTTANPTPQFPASPAPYAGWGDNTTSLLPFIPGRRDFYFSATPPTSTSASFPNTNAALPSSQPLNPNLIIEGLDYNPVSGTQDQEYFIIRNPNPYAVDISGWMLGGSVEMLFKGGTVIPGTSTPTSQATNAAYVNQLIVANKPQGLRTRTTSPTINEYRQVAGPYNHQLSARGGSIILSRPNDPLNPAAGYTAVVTQTYTGVPTAQQNFLRVTEINFEPAPATPAELAVLPGLVGADFEFLEITNTGTASMNLGGAYFDKGVEFIFPAGYTLAAGARCLIVASQSAFEIRYGTGLPIVGEYGGALNNGGDTVRLLDSVGEEVLDFHYDNNWFPLPTGTYRSLVTTSASPAATAYSDYSTWALSAAPNGTPNTGDTAYSQVYEGWRLAKFTTAELPTVLLPNLPAALTADPDGDGQNNFTEYAFATDPKSQNAAAAPVGSSVTIGPDTFQTITFKRPKNALDVTYTIEASSDLAATSWTALANLTSTATDLGNGQEQVTYRDTVPRQSTDRRFLRATALK